MSPHAVPLLGQKCVSYFQGHHLKVRRMGVICMEHGSLMEPPLAAFLHAPGVSPARRKRRGLLETHWLDRMSHWVWELINKAACASVSPPDRRGRGEMEERRGCTSVKVQECLKDTGRRDGGAKGASDFISAHPHETPYAHTIHFKSFDLLLSPCLVFTFYFTFYTHTHKFFV